jgi:hypothetical protein
MRILLLVTAFTLALAACSDEGSDLPDASAFDAAASDANRTDALVSDASMSPDAGLMDAGGGADTGTVAGWIRPACTTVEGTAGVTFTFDEGATLAPTAAQLSGTIYTYGLVALDRPNTLLAVHGPDVIRSTDSGCTWRSIGQLTAGFPPRLAKAGPDRAYGWSENNDTLFRVDGETVTLLVSPAANIMGLGVDPTNPDRLRIADNTGQIWVSSNAGARFEQIGAPAFPGNGLMYVMAFDPANLDHALAGAATEGARFTFDGGMTWTPSSGLTQTGTASRGANVFSIAISPRDPNVVWAEGIDLDENLAGAASEGRHIWRSTDGGRTFSPIVTRTAEVTLTNGVLLVPHPVDPAILYFEFGTYFQGYGTDLFELDADRDTLTKRHNDHDDVLAIDFMPGDPSVMYLGLTSEEVR